MKATHLIFFLVLASLWVTSPALAWDASGHIQVADIAWTRLNPQTRREVAAILMAGDPRFRPASDNEADVRDAFRKSATFPDAIKGNTNTSYEPIIAPMNASLFVHTKPNPNDNEDNRCKTWHYYDVPLHAKGKHAPKESNALAALTKAWAELTTLESTSSPDRAMQCWWLYWIEHIVGDLHQPLHCVSNYATLPEGDAGGNLFMIRLPGEDRQARLHGYWDGGIARAIGADREQGLSPNVEDVSQRWEKAYMPSRSAARNLNIRSWITAGAKLADKAVYKGIESGQEPAPDYTTSQIEICKRQAVLGGYRLAAMLNRVLGKGVKQADIKLNRRAERVGTISM